MTALGVVLLILGAVLIAVEAHSPSLGFLGGPGVITLGAGTLLAVSGLGGGIAVALLAAVVLVAASGGALALTVRKGMAVGRRQVRAGPEHLIGHLGTVRSWSEPAGSVTVDGALWRARRSHAEMDDPELQSGDPVVVERLDGLTLAVRRAEEWELVR